MTFARTRAGLYNQTDFLDCDVVVYLEGTEHVAASQIGYEDGEVCSLDCLFWGAVLSAVVPDMRVHYKPYGNKKSLLEFSSQLDETLRGRVLVAIDRDFDGSIPSAVDYLCTARTMTYSWESDVWTTATVESMLLNSLPLATLPAALKSEIRDCIKHYYVRSKRYSWFDASLYAADWSGLVYDRDSPSRFIRLGNGLPILKETDLRAKLRSLFRSLPGDFMFPYLPGFSVKRHTYGKMVRDHHVGVFRSIMIRAMGACTIHNHFLWMQGVHSFKKIISTHKGSRWEYYEREVKLALGV